MRYLQGTHESVYEYDGGSKRVRIKELTSGVETKNETFVWCGSRICQKRNSGGVVRNYFEQGFEEGTTDYFYSRDRLGSVREVVGSNGTTIASKLSYDPWGSATETGSGALSDFGFTGHHFDRPTGLNLAPFRAYSPLLGRWLSQDPIGLKGGWNLYGYVNNSPVGHVDELGLLTNYECKVICWGTILPCVAAGMPVLACYAIAQSCYVEFCDRYYPDDQPSSCK